MAKSRILIQLDSDSQPSTFDSVVAIDAGVEQLLRHGDVTRENVEGLVHGAMFTRGGDNLKSTALFVGGSDVALTESIVEKIENTFFGNVRVSLMADPNGANTTAAAAVLSAERHVDWSQGPIAILGGTGPVGLRIAQLLGGQLKQLQSHARIRIVSRSLSKATEACKRLENLCGQNCFDAVQGQEPESNAEALAGAQVVFAAGAAGIQLLDHGWLSTPQPPALAIDLNAVPPAGLPGIEVFDRGQRRESTICYGAIGVGGLKMKIHKRCIESLFEANDRRLLVAEIYQLGQLLNPG